MKRYVEDEDEDRNGNMHLLGMTEDPDGDWVKWEDVEALLDRICESTSDPSVHALIREALKP
jgi:hypothetical protein